MERGIMRTGWRGKEEDIGEEVEETSETPKLMTSTCTNPSYFNPDAASQLRRE